MFSFNTSLVCFKSLILPEIFYKNNIKSTYILQIAVKK